MALAASAWGLHRSLDHHLKSSCLSTFDHHYLDDRLSHVVQQPEGMASGQGERQAEVRHKVQTAWHLNMLPGSTAGLKDINSDEYWTVPTT